MRAPQSGSANGNGNGSLVKSRARASSELDDLRSTCQHQAHVIDALTSAVLTLRTGANALKAENAELRADLDRQHGRRRRSRTVASEAEAVEVRVALDVHA